MITYRELKTKLVNMNDEQLDSLVTVHLVSSDQVLTVDKLNLDGLIGELVYPWLEIQEDEQTGDKEEIFNLVSINIPLPRGA